MGNKLSCQRGKGYWGTVRETFSYIESLQGHFRGIECPFQSVLPRESGDVGWKVGNPADTVYPRAGNWHLQKAYYDWLPESIVKQEAYNCPLNESL